MVHIERLPEHGVRVWLDGTQIKNLRAWSLTEEHRPPSVLTFTINTDEIVWGPPPAGAADDVHFVVVGPAGRVTPSGKRACETCGESWVCSAEQRRLDSHRGLDNPSDAPLG